MQLAFEFEVLATVVVPPWQSLHPKRLTARRAGPSGSWSAEALHLLRADLLHIHAAPPVERCHPAVLLQAICVGGELNEADGLEASVLAGFFLEVCVPVATRVSDGHAGSGWHKPQPGSAIRTGLSCTFATQWTSPTWSQR